VTGAILLCKPRCTGAKLAGLKLADDGASAAVAQERSQPNTNSSSRVKPSEIARERKHPTRLLKKKNIAARP